MKTLFSYISLVLLTLLLCACAGSESDYHTPQDPLITASLEQIDELERSLDRNFIMDESTESTKNEFEGLLLRIRSTVLRLDSHPNDQKALSLLVELQRELKELKINERDASLVDDLHQSLGKIITHRSRKLGKALPELGYSLFKYNFGEGLKEFSTYPENGHNWRADWALDRSFVRAMSINQASETWLISPAFDLTNMKNPRFTLRHSLGVDRTRSGEYIDNLFDRMQIINEVFVVLVSTNYIGGTPDFENEDQNWTEVNISPMPSSVDFHTVTSPKVSLERFKGPRVTVALRLKTEPERHGHHFMSWQVEEFNLIGSSSSELNFSKTPVSLPEPEKAYEYNFDGKTLVDHQMHSPLPQGPQWEPFGMNDRGYAKIQNNEKAAHSWLLTPRFKLQGQNELFLRVHHSVNKPIWTKLRLKISKNYQGGDPAEAQWEELPIKPDSTDTFDRWTDLVSPDYDLSAYLGEEVVLGFEYEASESEFHAWEIERFFFFGDQAQVQAEASQE